MWGLKNTLRLFEILTLSESLKVAGRGGVEHVDTSLITALVHVTDQLIQRYRQIIFNKYARH
jgi:hypothetical protein